jgi:hypothetical protein
MAAKKKKKTTPKPTGKKQPLPAAKKKATPSGKAKKSPKAAKPAKAAKSAKAPKSAVKAKTAGKAAKKAAKVTKASRGTKATASYAAAPVRRPAPQSTTNHVPDDVMSMDEHLALAAPLPPKAITNEPTEPVDQSAAQVDLAKAARQAALARLLRS